MKPANGFDRLAGIYRWMEYLSFGPYLWRCRVSLLGQLGACRNALVLGDGDGRFTAALLRSNPAIQIHAVDASAPMLRKLESNAGQHGDRLTTEMADLRLWSPRAGTQYDLIVSHFFLDCLASEEIASLAQRLANLSAPRAIWVVSDFAIPATIFGRLIARPIIAGLYLSFRWLTGLRQHSLPDHQRALSQSGWTLRQETRLMAGMLFSQLWQRLDFPGTPSSELK